MISSPFKVDVGRGMGEEMTDHPLYKPRLWEFFSAHIQYECFVSSKIMNDG